MKILPSQDVPVSYAPVVEARNEVPLYSSCAASKHIYLLYVTMPGSLGSALNNPMAPHSLYFQFHILISNPVYNQHSQCQFCYQKNCFRLLEYHEYSPKFENI